MNHRTMWATLVVTAVVCGGAKGWFDGTVNRVDAVDARAGSRMPRDMSHSTRPGKLAATADTVTVQTAPELVAALKKGGIIQLQPGTYVGNFTIAVPGTVVRGLKAPGRRVAPADVSSVALAPASKLDPTLTISASKVTVQGIHITNGAPDRDCVVIGSYKATAAADQPDDVTLDSVAIVAGERGGHRGIAAHGSHITVIRSHVANFWEVGRDSQAFFANNGPGPYRLEDNYLEGSGENILFGGDSVRIKNLIPSDITIRNNDIVKPAGWKARRGAVKNSVEFKNARGVLLENNRIDGNWKDAQAGSPILITPRNQYGDCPWCGVDDVTIRGNIVTNTPDGYAVNILGTDNNHSSQQVRRVVIEGNLFKDARNGILVSGGVAESLVVRRNTFPAIRYNLMTFDGMGASRKPKVVTPLTLEANVFLSGQYGISGGPAGVGVRALEVWATPYTVKNNVIERSAKRPIEWPSGNKLLAPGALAALLDPETFKYADGSAGYNPAEAGSHMTGY